MKLAKPHIDIGLYTNNREAMLEFWQQKVGLEFDHVGKLGGGVHQLRHHMNGSILKINHARNPLPETPQAGYRELWIAREGISERRSMTDPDGNQVTLVPMSEDGIVGIEIVQAVRDLEAFRDFYGRILEFTDLGDDRFQCGDSIIRLRQDDSAQAMEGQHGLGYRYITMQIFDADGVFETVIVRGGAEGRQPRTLGTTVRFGFVRDPDGNWIELSERFELTGTGDAA
jgi:catechol 2,3-dioxygenase-like lactoylglutathione lyase family enzyme